MADSTSRFQSAQKPWQEGETRKQVSGFGLIRVAEAKKTQVSGSRPRANNGLYDNDEQARGRNKKGTRRVGLCEARRSAAETSRFV